MLMCYPVLLYDSRQALPHCRESLLDTPMF